MSLPCAPILCGGPVLPDRKCLRRCREKEWREVVPDGSRPGPSGSVEQPNLGSAVGTADHGWGGNPEEVRQYRTRRCWRSGDIGAQEAQWSGDWVGKLGVSGK